MRWGHSLLPHHIRGLLYDSKRILQHSKHSWIQTSQCIMSSSDLGLARVSEKFDDLWAHLLVKNGCQFMTWCQSMLHHHIRGLTYDGKRILQHPKHSWIQTSHCITSSSVLGLARVSEKFDDLWAHLLVKYVCQVMDEATHCSITTSEAWTMMVKGYYSTPITLALGYRPVIALRLAVT